MIFRIFSLPFLCMMLFAVFILSVANHNTAHAQDINIPADDVLSIDEQGVEAQSRNQKLGVQSEGFIDEQVLDTPLDKAADAQTDQELDVFDMKPMFFTDREYDALLRSIAARAFASLPNSDELLDRANIPAEDKPIPPPESRYLKLGGISYSSSKDWTIWMNNMRITPNVMPPEIIEIKVQKDKIDVRWFDEYTNKIYPVRLRPHQQFHLDQKVFLPG